MFVLGKVEKQISVTLFTTLVVIGCGGGDSSDSAGSSSASSEATVMENPVDPSTAGNISGSVAFEGTAPAMAAIDMSGEQVCADKHSATPMVQTVVVNDNGTLSNVFCLCKRGQCN